MIGFKVGDKIRLRADLVDTYGFKAHYFAGDHRVDRVEGLQFSSESMLGCNLRPQSDFVSVALKVGDIVTITVDAKESYLEDFGGGREYEITEETYDGRWNLSPLKARKSLRSLGVDAYTYHAMISRCLTSEASFFAFGGSGFRWGKDGVIFARSAHLNVSSNVKETVAEIINDSHMSDSILSEEIKEMTLKVGRWYRIKSGPLGGRIMKCYKVILEGYVGCFSVDSQGYEEHTSNLTRLSYHSTEVQEQIKSKEPIMNPDYNKTHGYVRSDAVYEAKHALEKALEKARANKLALEKANKPPEPIVDNAELKKASKEPKEIEALVEKVIHRNMAELRAVATSFVGTESNKRIERVKYDLLRATEVNILEIEAIKAGVKQPRKVNWPAVIIGLIGVATTITAYVL